MSDWLKSFFPEHVNLLGQRLEPLSLGHCMVLERLRNPLFIGGNANVDHLFEAVYVCCQPASDSWNSFFDVDFPKKILTWRKKIGRHDFARSMKVFLDYKNDSTIFPEMGGGDEPEKRKLGSPFLLQIKIMLQSKLGYSESAALNKPIGASVWEVMALSELEGHSKILNEIELDIAKIHRELIEKGDS